MNFTLYQRVRLLLLIALLGLALDRILTPFWSALGWAVVLSFLLRPFLVSSQAPVSTLMVFVGAVGGASAFGLIGLIIGPVLLSLVAAVVHFAEEARGARPKALAAPGTITVDAGLPP